ncbi:hypothetical protein PPL_08088 [Heterostelium album PN500]|uniref:Ankyrin repeat-containing protein n=1 Tax=Heterostelium pallidum (strain ATCC 26659 / Pp 5 / PN500) TaxID=670386 RepID=D3BIK9_HETP5|nr:hypothetical protein PPL_08088 [Heterostelium album PN500]EFA78633.1 hypothetical protein PPL_08088 [Heterostelium album PN500]|eukprot:XP_020430757.1 hypothetical protein PPL_08088 [Heterostelium album PN500]
MKIFKRDEDSQIHKYKSYLNACSTDLYVLTNNLVVPLNQKLLDSFSPMYSEEECITKDSEYEYTKVEIIPSIFKSFTQTILIPEKISEWREPLGSKRKSKSKKEKISRDELSTHMANGGNKHNIDTQQSTLSKNNKELNGVHQTLIGVKKFTQTVFGIVSFLVLLLYDTFELLLVLKADILIKIKDEIMGWRDELTVLIRSESITVSKIRSLTQSLLSNVQKNVNVCQCCFVFKGLAQKTYQPINVLSHFFSIDETLHQCKPFQILNCLYIIDAILRDVSHIQNQIMYVNYYYYRLLKDSLEFDLTCSNNNNLSYHNIYNKRFKTFSDSFFSTLLYYEKKIIETIPEQYIMEMETESIPIVVDKQYLSRGDSLVSSQLQKRKLELIENSLDILMPETSGEVDGNDHSHQSFNNGITSNHNDSGSTISNSVFSIGMLSSGSEVLKKLKSHHNSTTSNHQSSLSTTATTSVRATGENCTFWRELSFNNVKNFSNNHLYRIIQSYGSQIVKLDLSFCNYVDKRAVNMIVTYCQSIQTLSLCKCPLGDEDLAQFLKYLGNLKNLNVSQSSYSNRMLVKLFGYQGLKKLNIACSHGLLDGLFLKPCLKVADSLECLNIDCYCSTFIGFGVAGAVQEFLTNNNTLKTVKLHHMLIIDNYPSNIAVRTTNLWKFVKFNDCASTKEILTNISSKQLNKRYYNGCTSIFLASEEGKLEQLKLLIAKGADHTICNYHGISPIMASRNIQTAKLWIEKKVEPTNKTEKDFLSVISVLEKYYKYLKPNISDHPSIDEVKGEELEILLTVINTNSAGGEVVELTKILTASFLKIPSLLKRILENSKSNRKSLIYSTIGDDDFFCRHIQQKLKKSQQQSVLLDLLAMA